MASCLQFLQSILKLLLEIAFRIRSQIMACLCHKSLQDHYLQNNSAFRAKSSCPPPHLLSLTLHAIPPLLVPGSHHLLCGLCSLPLLQDAISTPPLPSVETTALHQPPLPPTMPLRFQSLAKAHIGAEAAGAPSRNGHSFSVSRAEISVLKHHPSTSPFLILHFLLGIHRKHQKYQWGVVGRWRVGKEIVGGGGVSRV